MWKNKISRLLGAFWTCVVGASKTTIKSLAALEELTAFIFGVSYAYGEHFRNIIHRFITGRIYKSKKIYQKTTPYQILLVADTYRQDLSDTFEEDTTKGWWIEGIKEYDSPYMLQTTDVGSSITFFRGIDYIYDNGNFYFFSDITKLPAVDLSRKVVTKEDGSICVCYCFMGHTNTQTTYDAVTGFYSKELNPVADIVWDIHQNGATVYNVKKLLCGASNAVIADNDGTVTAVSTDIAKDQGYNYVIVDGIPYISKDYVPNVTAGNAVKKGDTLFGDIVLYTGQNTIVPESEDVPAIDVMTDAGLMRAYNESKPITVSNVLPLSGTTEQVTAYTNICQQIQQDTDYPSIDIGTAGETINPFAFIMQRLRRNTGCLVVTSVTGYDYMSAALSFLDKNISTASVFNVYIKAVNAPESLSLDISNIETSVVAISDSATVNIQEVTTEGTINQ